jgi:hypothetical protein
MPERAKPKLVEEVTAPTVKTKSRARSYAVGCKLPSGLILDLFNEEEFEESMPGAGSRMRKVWRRNFEDNGQRIVLTGTEDAARRLSAPISTCCTAGGSRETSTPSVKCEIHKIKGSRTLRHAASSIAGTSASQSRLRPRRRSWSTDVGGALS